jgi:hypothetical protein
MSQKLSDVLNRSSVSPNNDDKSLKVEANKVQIIKLPSGNNTLHTSSDVKSKIVSPANELTYWTGRWRLTGDTSVSDRSEVIDDIFRGEGSFWKKVGKYLEDKGKEVGYKLAGNIISDIIPADENTVSVLNFLNSNVSSNSWLGKVLNKGWFRNISASWLSSSAAKRGTSSKIVSYRGDAKNTFITETKVGYVEYAPRDERLSGTANKYGIGNAIVSKFVKSGRNGIHGSDRASEWAQIARQQLSSDTIQHIIAESIKSEADKLNIPCQVPDSKIMYFGGNIQDAIGTILARDVVYGDIKSGSQGVKTKDSETSSSSDPTNSIRRYWQKYGNRADPYNEAKTIEKNKRISLNDVIENIRSSGLESDYHMMSGFEIGSNHDWIIRLSPYYSPIAGRYTCTPPLPCYQLPRNAIMQHDSENGLTSKGWYDQLKKGVTEKVYARVHDRLKSNGYSVSDHETIDDNNNYFSFGYDCPCLTYNFNIGTIRSDQLKLWNGDTIDTFNGMNYHMTLNMSILDDIYGSMNKYLMSYINACYDSVGGSMAPYWASLFVIDLIIFRTGKQINWRFKLIGSPIEWSPSLTGENSPNESRVDITFSIVGLIQPGDIISDKNSGYNEDRFIGTNNKFHGSWHGNDKPAFSLAKLKKSDFGIQVNIPKT